jgi:hypothetical protein
MRKAKQPKTLYAFWANMCGPWYITPEAVTYREDLGSWWNKDYNSEVESIGLTEREGYVCYASADKEDVERFIEGFLSCRRLLRGFLG